MSDSISQGRSVGHSRRPLNQHGPRFHDTDDLNQELRRVFDICHGCRRCVNLCNTFPTLFKLIDESDSCEVDGVASESYQQVVDQCYLCDLCYRSKCPYVPPHEWNMDFPQSMLRAKVVRFEQHKGATRDRLITSTDMIGKAATLPLVNPVVNALTRHGGARWLLERTLDIHKHAPLPRYTRPTLRQRFTPERNLDKQRVPARAPASIEQAPTIGQGPTPSANAGGKAILFSTCYCNFNEPDIGASLYRVLRHNDVDVRFARSEHCCGMPKLELGDLRSVDRQTQHNIQVLYPLAQAGWSIIAAVPSCVLMFRQTLPTLYPHDEQVRAVADAFCDPFEFLQRLHRRGRLNLEFRRGLGTVSYHVACHQRAQGIGPRTQQILELIPDTTVKRIERCSGHNGTYAVKKESHDIANRIAAPVVTRVTGHDPDHLGSDCPMAGRHIEARVTATDPHSELTSRHPLQLLCMAYGI